MPSGSFWQADVRCPFYKYDDGKRRITCEGIIDDSSLALIYHNKKDFETQISVFCCEHYKKCEVYRMLMEKYEEEQLYDFVHNTITNADYICGMSVTLAMIERVIQRLMHNFRSGGDVDPSAV